MAVPNSCSTVSGFQGPRPPFGGLPRQAARLYITRVPRPPQDSVSRSIIPPYLCKICFACSWEQPRPGLRPIAKWTRWHTAASRAGTI